MLIVSLFLFFSLSLLLVPSLSFCKKVRGLILHKECRRPRNTLKLVSKFRSELSSEVWQNSTLMMFLAFSRFPCPIKNPMRYLFPTASREFQKSRVKSELVSLPNLSNSIDLPKMSFDALFPPIFQQGEKNSFPDFNHHTSSGLGRESAPSPPSFDTWRIYWPKRSFEPSILAPGERWQEPNWWN